MSLAIKSQASNVESGGVLMLSAQDVAKLLQCSDKHVNNLRRQGRIPSPVKLGALTRWPRRDIENWVAAGCPKVA